jgi:serine/threonine-protein kinase
MQSLSLLVCVSLAVVSGTRIFGPNEWMNQDITNATIDSESANIINGLKAAGGWGTGAMQIDFSITVLQGDSSTPMMSFNPTDDFYTPDCDMAQVPVPPNGSIEGETGYACTHDGDCHLIVLYPPTTRLYEMWRANIVTVNGKTTFNGGCLAIWNYTKPIPADGRGQSCTSADAGGFPIASLLFSSDEVIGNGIVDHAIRFILPNDRIRRLTFVHPSTHSTSSSGGSNTPPYGARLRLKSTFDMSKLPNNYARIVAKAMQQYGIVLSDGGNIALTAASDKYSTNKWSGKLGSHDLQAILVTDFDVITGGTRYSEGDCVRSPYA